MNRVYLKPKNELGESIPLINLSRKLEIKGNYNRSKRLEILIRESLKTNGYLEFENIQFRKLIGINHRITQDLAMSIINQYLDNSHFEREKNQRYVFCGKGEKHNDILDMNLKGDLLGHCSNCDMDSRKMMVRIKNINRVSLYCYSCKVLQSYVMVEE